MSSFCLRFISHLGDHREIMASHLMHHQAIIIENDDDELIDPSLNYLNQTISLQVLAQTDEARMRERTSDVMKCNISKASDFYFGFR